LMTRCGKDVGKIVLVSRDALGAFGVITALLVGRGRVLVRRNCLHFTRTHA
jgi:hypothetical protein